MGSLLAGLVDCQLLKSRQFGIKYLSLCMHYTTNPTECSCRDPLSATEYRPRSREIMQLVVSVRPFVLFLCLNCLTCDLDFCPQPQWVAEGGYWMAITFKYEAKMDCNQSMEFFCVSVVWGLMWIISWTWSISF